MPARYLKATTMDPAQHAVPQRPDPAAIELPDKEFERASAAKGRDKRPAFDRLCKAVTRRKIDVVAAWSVDRLGRSLQDLVGFSGS
jgi:DNA invertase Pin-like site-specific DNA recombinase